MLSGFFCRDSLADFWFMAADVERFVFFEETAFLDDERGRDRFGAVRCLDCDFDFGETGLLVPGDRSV